MFDCIWQSTVFPTKDAVDEQLARCRAEDVKHNWDYEYRIVEVELPK